MAEAIARRDAGDVIAPLSAGIAALGFVIETTKETLTANGYATEELRSKQLSEELWDSADVVINMTGRPAALAFHRFASLEKVEDWLVADPYGEDPALYQKICEELQGRVRSMADRLRKDRARAEATR